MKKTLVTILTALAAAPLLAQESGKIVYTETVKMELPQIDGIDSAMLAAFPRERTVKRELLFNAEAALYHKLPETKKSDEELMEEQSGIVIRMDEPNDQFYSDFKQKKAVSQRDFMSRLFLIETPLESPQWKLTGRQKTILGYVCQEAQIVDSIQPMTVWFTPQIPTAAGPAGLAGFPGMVLGAEMDNGNFVFMASQIDLVPVTEITRPTEGRKMTEEKFRAMVDEKTREMQEQYGGDGNTVIRVITN